MSIVLPGSPYLTASPQQTLHCKPNPDPTHDYLVLITAAHACSIWSVHDLVGDLDGCNDIMLRCSYSLAMHTKGYCLCARPSFSAVSLIRVGSQLSHKAITGESAWCQGWREKPQQCALQERHHGNQRGPSEHSASNSPLRVGLQLSFDTKPHPTGLYIP